ncbi:hypothetical protein [Puniceibacterium sediminis]|nr:hypothetical protein [Puniceibacterium sediminis]
MRLMIDGVMLTAACLICGSLLISASLGSDIPVVGKPVLVVAPPWDGGAAAIVRAVGGVAVGPVAAPFAMFAVFEHKGFAEAALKAGAWTLRDAGALSAFCTTGETT